MKKLTWDDSYLIGYSLVDKEHKKLFEIAHRAFSAVVENEKISKIKSIVLELIDYTKVHFKNEESYMESVAYPVLKEHKILHQNILVSMNKFLKTINQMQINELEKDLAYFIEQWFINHIIYEDKKISKFVATKQENTYLEWNVMYQIGAEQIDKEHQELFHIANQAFTCKDAEKIRQSILELYAHIQKHFENEELLMKSVGFDEIEEHVLLHKNIQEELTVLLKSFSTLDLSSLQFKLHEFIKSAIIDHIKKEDMKLGNWIRYTLEKPEIKEI